MRNIVFIKLSAKIIDSWQILTFFVHIFCKDLSDLLLEKNIHPFFDLFLHFVNF